MIGVQVCKDGAFSYQKEKPRDRIAKMHASVTAAMESVTAFDVHLFIASPNLINIKYNGKQKQEK